MPYLLDYSVRPLVMFDPSKKEHRTLYFNFLRDRSWGKCPYRFAVDGENQNNNLAFAMQRMMVEHYLAKEFKETVDGL